MIIYSLGTDEYITQAVKTHSDSMLRAAYAVLKSTADAEDAVQEAFIKLITKNPEFKDSHHEKAWLLRVTINISHNMLKKASRKNLPLNEEIPYESQNENQVLRAVLSLQENYRTVIHLHYYEGYSIKEIAEILNIPQATVGTRLSRGRKALRSILEGVTQE